MKKLTITLPGLYGGILIERPNRFLAIVQMDSGKRVKAFVADPGRLKELLFPGSKVFLAYASKEGRRTDYDLSLVENGNQLVSIDSRVLNKLAAKGLEENIFKQFNMYTDIKKEPNVGNSRLDFKLTAEDLPDCFIEVKSCTLVKDGKAFFPDAPTSRGARHLKDLSTAKIRGCRASIIFIIQHRGAEIFTPNSETDPFFSQELSRAKSFGVEIYAYKCSVTFQNISLTKELPVELY